MIDFDRPPTPKSAEETEFDELNERYTESFGQPYVFFTITDDNTWAETLAEIRRCLETGKRQPEPRYKRGQIY